MQADTCLGNTSDPLSLNLYTYCLNNPHKYTDPSGHFAITAGIVIGAIIWGIVGAGIEYKMQKDAGGIIDYNHVIFQGTLNAAIALVSGGTANGMMATQQGARMTARTFGRKMLMEAGFGVTEGIIGETGYQLIEGKKLKDLSAGKIAVSGVMGGASGIGGALAGEVIGAGLKVLKNTRVVSKAINTMQDMASRGKNAIRRGVDKLADFGRHQLGLESVAYVTPEGFLVRGPRVPDNGMRLFAGSGNDGMSGGKAYRGGSSLTPKTLYHYTNEKGMTGIVESKKLNPSLKANNPKDARFGDGQYLSDIKPDNQTPVSLAQRFIHRPNRYKYTHYVEIDISDLEVIKGREGVYVIPNNESLDLTDRIISTGSVGIR